jgi:hypothetical protein
VPPVVQPALQITSPAAYANLPPTFSVTGTGQGLYAGGLVVRAQTSTGTILVDRPVTLQGSNVGSGGAGSFSATLTVNVATATPGFIVAFAPQTPTAAAVSVPVTFLPGAPSQPLIQITSPTANSTLPATFTVTGQAQGLNGPNLTVRAEATDGSPLAQQPLALQGPGAATGTGTFSVQLTVSGAVATPGRIIVSAPQTPAAQAASVTVTFAGTTPGGPVYMEFDSQQCRVKVVQGAQYYDVPGGAARGQFGNNRDYEVLRGAKLNSQYWFLVGPLPSTTTLVWAPQSSVTNPSPACVGW